MNEIQTLKTLVATAFPSATIELTAPARTDGIWWLDIVHDRKRIVIEWSASTNFGVTTPDADSFGEHADESHSSLEKALQRVRDLLVNNDRTSPPFTVLLARLREKRGITQQELASRLGIKQASVSGLERREDMQLSTLRKFIHALGGCVQIVANFPDERFTLEGSFFEGILPSKSSKAEPLLSFRETSAFVELRNAGKMQHAMEVAGRVKEKHTLLEMV